jgi:hypothetical protein
MSSGKLAQFKSFVTNASKSKQLYKLDSIAPVRVWDYAAPTIVQDSCFTNRVPWNESSQFAAKFFETYPILQNIDMSNLAIAGGAVIDFLLERSPKDIDIFVITGKPAGPESADFAKKRIEKFVSEIYDLIHKRNQGLNETQAKKQLTNPNFKVNPKEFADMNKFNVQRFRNVYTVRLPNMPVPLQLIATPYSSLNEFFDRVDLQCTSVAYYEGEVLFSELGKFCFENLAVVLDKQFKDVDQITRLVKYFNKGFDIILPDLDVAKIRTYNFQFNLQEMLDLPFLDVTVNKVHENKIDTISLTPSKRCLEEAKGEQTTAMYPGKDQTNNTGGIGIHKNISNLNRDKWQDFIYEGQGPSYKNAFLDRPLITERMIVNTYRTVEQKIYKNGALNVDAIEKFFTIRNLSTIMDELVVQFIKKEETHPTPGLITGPKFSRHVKEKVEALVKEQVELTKEKLMTLQKAHIAFPTDVIESKMAPCSKDEWYGSYLHKEAP